ncbi:hypothetical protein [Egbenema bharatensis]|uniref:hypothetical protein n=1 Tax=Egbenema bharatensis TaxID=3463334 RepID=UPI003A84FCCF
MDGWVLLLHLTIQKFIAGWAMPILIGSLNFRSKRATGGIMNGKRTPYHDELSLSDAAEEWGKKAVQSGLIPSFVVRHFADSSQFYIPDEHHEPLTPEQAYMQLRKLIEQSDK